MTLDKPCVLDACVGDYEDLENGKSAESLALIVNTVEVERVLDSRGQGGALGSNSREAVHASL